MRSNKPFKFGLVPITLSDLLVVSQKELSRIPDHVIFNKMWAVEGRFFANPNPTVAAVMMFLHTEWRSRVQRRLPSQK